MVFEKIEEFYKKYHQELLESDLRPQKSIIKNFFNGINNIQEFYNEIKKDTFEKEDYTDFRGKDTNTSVEELRTWEELRFIMKLDSSYKFTDKFLKFHGSKQDLKDYLKEWLFSIKEIKDINMLINSIICLLREGYLCGKIIKLENNLGKFKADFGEEESKKLCEIIYKIYGYKGRNNNQEFGEYTPSANERIIGTVIDLGLITKLEDKSYTISLEGFKFLEILSNNLDIDTELKQPKKDKKIKITFSYNTIIYGAPGTGKSFKLKTELEKISEEKVRRVTFYPGFSYGQFVGTYKPKPILKKNVVKVPEALKVAEEVSYEMLEKKNDTKISYEYTPGIFMETLVNAFNNKEQEYFLIIEEINRSKADSVFGDVFQLLDRGKDGNSEYGISPTEEMRGYLIKELGKDKWSELKIEDKGLKIPFNMYIWATMNSADQGVYPMDTAFKRRWNFEYIGLNENYKEFGKNDERNKNKNLEEKYKDYFIDLNVSNEENEKKKKMFMWDDFRKAINEYLEVEVTEDRLLAPFFVKEENFEEEDGKFILDNEVFLSKILMYLFDDVLRHKKKVKLFHEECKSFSRLKERYNKEKYEDGLCIFHDKFIKKINPEIKES